MVTTSSGTIASFKATEAKPLTSLKVYFSPIQNGSGDPSPSNVRTISGKTSVQVVHCGRNMFNVKDYYENGYGTMTSHGVTATMREDGSVILNGTAVDTNAIFNYDIGASYLPAGNYYTSVGPHDTTIHAPYAWNGSASARLRKWDGTTAMAYSNTGIFTEIKIPENYNPQSVLVALRCMTGKTANNDIFYPQIVNSIENPDNVTWEPYHGQTYAISWSSEAGEVYGGYYDLVSGELVATHIVRTYIGASTENWVKSTVNAKFVIVVDDARISAFNTRIKVISNIGLFRASGDANYTVFMHQASATASKWLDYFPPSTVTESVDTFKQWLSENNLQVCYELETPIIRQLTPQQISTFIGRNNIWGIDCDRVEVAYDFAESVDIIRHRQRVLKGCQVYRTILPPGYKEYDWLEGPSGSNSRIDTGVPGNDTTLQIDAEFMPIALNDNSYYGIYGNYVNENDSYCWRIILMAKTSTNFNCGYYVTCGNNSAGGGGTSAAYPTYNAGPMEGVKCKTRMTYGELYMEGYRTWSVTRSYAAKQENATNIAIGSSRVTATGGTAIFHYYKFKFTSNGKVIRDYRPCIRLSDNKAGFYDLVNYTFNPSIGTVDFTAGNDIGGLYVYKDNSVYDTYTSDETANSTSVNNDFFITGFYDTGSETEKSFTITCNPAYPYGDGVIHRSQIRFYNDKTGTAVSTYHVGQTYATRTLSATGRYIMCSVYKPNAANFYIFDNTNNRYVVKGSNVT